MKKRGNRKTKDDRAAKPAENKKKYIQFQLDATARSEIERMAKESGRTPFDVCVTLLEKRVSESGTSPAPPDSQGPPEAGA